MSELQRYGQEWDSIVEMSDGEYVLYEDVAPLLAERDPTPVTADWLNGVLGDGGAHEADGYAFWWISTRSLMCVVRRGHGAFELQVEYDDALGRPPTRGDVLTALRLFGQTPESTH